MLPRAAKAAFYVVAGPVMRFNGWLYRVARALKSLFAVTMLGLAASPTSGAASAGALRISYFAGASTSRYPLTHLANKQQWRTRTSYAIDL